MARLRRVDCSGPGIGRRRRGRGFEFLDEDGRRVSDPEVIDRIRDLAIPPAWEDVWICPYPMGHLQATGVDDAGRKQYLYHPKWRERRDQEKFDSMVDFARALPRMRRAVAKHLERGDMSRERVLACTVRLLDHGFFRVGGESYATENETYGLATIRKDHVELSDGKVTFDYPAKGGEPRVQSIVDPQVREVVAALKRRRQGAELLAFKRGGRWVDVRSDDINEYVKDVTGGDFSAKDFRTWNATVLAAVALAVSGPAASGSKTGRKRAIKRAVDEVAGYLGNTPAVARSSYIDPRIFDCYLAGRTIGGVLTEVGDGGDLGSLHGSVEDAVLDLLVGERSPAIEQVA
jgi:DNA topoisomerase IB